MLYKDTAIHILNRTKRVKFENFDFSPIFLATIKGNIGGDCETSVGAYDVVGIVLDV